MSLQLRQQLKLAQQLVMTPQLQQAIRLLQLSRLELSDTVQEEIEQNPVLEDDTNNPDSLHESLQELTAEGQEPAASGNTTDEVNLEKPSGLKEINWEDYANEYEDKSSFKPQNDPDLPSRFDILTKKTNLSDHLQWQLKFANINDQEEVVGNFIIGNLDQDGFLGVSDEEIAAATKSSALVVQKVLAMVQDMDPPGIAARSLQESLLLQLAHLNLSTSTAGELVRNHLPSLTNRDYAAIVKASGHPLKEVLAALEVIKGLNPYPGRIYSDEEPRYIIPDVYVYKMDGEYVIVLNDDGMPRLKISRFYQDILKGHKDVPGLAKDTKNYIQGKLKSAMWLIKSIQQRQRTIYNVVESLLKFQHEFFEKGPDYMRPLILKDVADDINMHESTISRVTTNKYVHTPQGLFELKYFFNSAIARTGGEEALASESIKVKMKRLIQAEDPHKPLSDMAVVKILAQENNIKIARRTVAKYRENMGILPSKYRRAPKLT
ncbi:RNA polymerase sigma-54 factor RpoN [hydrothermal vent metagenome]|uniref:RNA polymerase sigma-54 factor RpoN n=1 Tax=hydrothermal vent metagenome TaxID=652676 RepID=A0A3B0UQ64_9ZZZZ